MQLNWLTMNIFSLSFFIFLLLKFTMSLSEQLESILADVWCKYLGPVLNMDQDVALL